MRFDNFGAGTDLSLFDQAIWHYSRFEAPFSTIKGFDLLGDHFHPAVALMAPLYWIWSDPRMLLVAASVMVSASTIPVFLFARRYVTPLAASLLTLAYAVFWGLQVGVGYEFHESELGPPLIAVAMLLAHRRRWGWLSVVLLLTLGVKEDLSMFVVFFGIYLITVAEVRRGVVFIVAGLAWFEFATRIAIPHFSPIGHYAYWSYSELGAIYRRLSSLCWRRPGGSSRSRCRRWRRRTRFSTCSRRSSSCRSAPAGSCSRSRCWRNGFSRPGPPSGARASSTP